MAESKSTGNSRSEEKNRNRASQSPRNKLLYIGSVVILVLVVVTFVGVPAVGSFGQGSGSIVFGRYNGEEIAYRPGNFLARQYEVVAQSLRDSSGELDLELQLRIAWRQAFNRTVLRTAILQQAGRSDVRVTEDKVDELIAQDPRFQQNGRFDRNAYRTMSNQERFSLRGFHRESEIFNLFVGDVLSGSVTASDEARFVASMSGPERSFDIVRFPFESFPEQQVRAYAENNDALFTEMMLSIITLGTRDEAEGILTQAREPGNPFGELARTYSRDLYADQSGEIGKIFGYEMQQELINPDDLPRLTALASGSLSDPIETTAGWAFFRAEADPVAFDASREDMIREARSYMQMFEQGRIQDFVRQEAQDFARSVSDSDLAAAAQVRGSAVYQTPFFPINYGNLQLFTQINVPEIPDLQDAAYRESFFVTAFSLQPGEVSGPVMLRQSAIVLSLREEREANENTVTFLEQYYDSILGQIQSDEIETAYIQEEYLDDNFLPAFDRYVLGRR
jgi:peptidyl-prolyl cis-trans isomerase D